jgi:hypothetical protein
VARWRGPLGGSKGLLGLLDRFFDRFQLTVYLSVAVLLYLLLLLGHLLKVFHMGVISSKVIIAVEKNLPALNLPSFICAQEYEDLFNFEHYLLFKLPLLTDLSGRFLHAFVKAPEHCFL